MKIETKKTIVESLIGLGVSMVVEFGLGLVMGATKEITKRRKCRKALKSVNEAVDDADDSDDEESIEEEN